MDPLNVLQRIGQGRFLEELTVALADVANEVVQTGKKGRVTVSFDLTVREQGDAMVLVAESINRKPPTRATRGSFLYAIDEWLYAEDPRQTKLNFREVDRPAADQRELDPAAPIVREA